VWAYFDTSALVKRYVDEPGRREVQQVLRRHECVTSAILQVELRSALRRRVAERALDSPRVSEILKRVAADRAYWTVIEVGAEVLSGAEALVSAHPLRTLDAIHVASAQMFAARLSITDLIFVSADKRQAEAASAIGLETRLIASSR
jgi:predicted nucleic acid-binding protein